MTISRKAGSSVVLLYFILGWGLLNLLQARVTPLDNDEAYYWVYSQFPAWGYFDHPPMIALMIRPGFYLFQNELGVRLMTVLSSMLTIYLVWKLIDSEIRERTGSAILFVIAILALPAFNIFGFISIPDSPLLLFSALFLTAYKRFIEKESLSGALLLGFSMAALMYSKYHGALLIICVILSNWRLFTNRFFYTASVIAVVLYIPHLLWQYSNGFPSFRYHLVERVSGFEPQNILVYFMNMLMMHHPLLLPVFLWVIFRKKTVKKFEHALKYTITGFLIFFFFESFQYHIQAQWTSLVSIPLVILFLNYSHYSPAAARWFKWAGIITIPLFLFTRIAFMYDFLPVSYLKDEFHHNKTWAGEIKKIAGSKPVVFTNSYQNASVYRFYTGGFAHSLNNLDYRKNQYDLWDFEEQLHGREVLYLPHFMTDELREKMTSVALPYGDTLYCTTFNDFQSLQRECVVLGYDKYAFSGSDTNLLNFKIYNPYPFPIDLKHSELPVSFRLAFITGGRVEYRKEIELPDDIGVLNPSDTINAVFRFTLHEVPSGFYKIAVCSSSGLLYETYNSPLREAVVTGQK